jgi:hypothetical protein
MKFAGIAAVSVGAAVVSAVDSVARVVSPGSVASVVAAVAAAVVSDVIPGFLPEQAVAAQRIDKTMTEIRNLFI